MTRVEKEHLDNIIVNENAYFFENEDEIDLSDNKIEKVFRDARAASDKNGHYLLKLINEQFVNGAETYNYSVCVFKYNTSPTFIDEPKTNWYETKLAYMVIIDFGEYIVISKRNISGVKKFIDQFTPLDYGLLSTLFVDDNTSFEKFALKNMNISDKAVRGKSLEAIDLRENFSPLGANNYILNNMRVNNDNEKVSLSLNTSRINKFGKKGGVDEFIKWSRALIDRIVNHRQHKTFLSIFAEPQDYEKERDHLVPIAILFLFSKLYEELESGRIADCKYVKDGVAKSFPITKHLFKIERLSQIEAKVEGAETKYFVKTSITNDLEIKFNQKSITLKSTKLNNVILIKSNGYKESIVEFINQSNQFILNFDDLDLIYTNRKLFKDSLLLGNIDYFLNIFKPYRELGVITSEKGVFTNASTSFTAGSTFNFIESQFLNDSKYFICDDLGKEWTDYISITDDKIVFYLGKAGTSQYSATAFQDIVGQAQKNLGNMSPQDYQIDGKLDFWKEDYKSNVPGNNVQTAIPRLRKGDTVENACEQFKKTKLEPNLKREMYLVLNFISKAGLTTKLEQLKDGEAFAERNEIIQILWFISSLIASCREVGVDIYICCKD